MICDSFSGYFQKLNTMNEVVVHRPGPFKHANKRHKTGRHRAKGTVDDENKGKLVYTIVKCVCSGRVNVKELSKSAKKCNSRNVRRNQLNQTRTAKRLAVVNEKRSLGGDTAPPFLTVSNRLLSNNFLL
jgi:pre-rRNA-processing protein TSR1